MDHPWVWFGALVALGLALYWISRRKCPCGCGGDCTCAGAGPPTQTPAAGVDCGQAYGMM